MSAIAKPTDFESALSFLRNKSICKVTQKWNEDEEILMIMALKTQSNHSLQISVDPYDLKKSANEIIKSAQHLWTQRQILAKGATKMVNAKLGLTVAQASEELGIGKTSILKLINNRELESYKILRKIYIPQQAIDAYIDKCHRPRFDAASVQSKATKRTR
ncbi:MAG TPA: helix-turn-helix domain-containing protein [Drouetiella sp.]